jgi:hypothetical protein
MTKGLVVIPWSMWKRYNNTHISKDFYFHLYIILFYTVLFFTEKCRIFPHLRRIFMVGYLFIKFNIIHKASPRELPPVPLQGTPKAREV